MEVPENSGSAIRLEGLNQGRLKKKSKIFEISLAKKFQILILNFEAVLVHVLHGILDDYGPMPSIFELRFGPEIFEWSGKIGNQEPPVVDYVR